MQCSGQLGRLAGGGAAWNHDEASLEDSRLTDSVEGLVMLTVLAAMPGMCGIDGVVERGTELSREKCVPREFRGRTPGGTQFEIIRVK